jgi:cell division septation protein DedD
VMEQLRLISNVHDDAGALLQIILVGQPSLDAVLLRPELRQLKQRVSRHVRLEPLGIAELSQYIDHRLAIARDGGRPKGGATFTPEALSAIWRLSGGTPRVINLLCDRSLEAAYEQQARSVDAPLVDGAAEELGIQRPPAAPAPTAWSAPAAIAKHPPEDPAPAKAPQAPAEAGPPARSVAWPDPGELPVAYEEAAEIETPRRSNRSLVVAAVVIVAAAAAWFAVRGLRGTEPANSSSTSTPAERQPATSAAPAAAPAAPEVQTPSSPAASAPAAAPIAAAPTSRAPTPSAPPTPAATSSLPAPAPASAPAEAAGSFEIVVASFRTVTRASGVAAELTALGQRVRQRTADGWEQVLVGPFPTREAAVAAQEQLDHAGYTGTQIVPAPR